MYKGVRHFIIATCLLFILSFNNIAIYGQDFDWTDDYKRYEELLKNSKIDFNDFQPSIKTFVQKIESSGISIPDDKEYTLNLMFVPLYNDGVDKNNWESMINNYSLYFTNPNSTILENEKLYNAADHKFKEVLSFYRNEWQKKGYEVTDLKQEYDNGDYANLTEKKNSLAAKVMEDKKEYAEKRDFAQREADRRNDYFYSLQQLDYIFTYGSFIAPIFNSGPAGKCFSIFCKEGKLWVKEMKNTTWRNDITFVQDYINSNYSASDIYDMDKERLKTTLDIAGTLLKISNKDIAFAENLPLIVKDQIDLVDYNKKGNYFLQELKTAEIIAKIVNKNADKSVTSLIESNLNLWNFNGPYTIDMFTNPREKDASLKKIKEGWGNLDKIFNEIKKGNQLQQEINIHTDQMDKIKQTYKSISYLYNSFRFEKIRLDIYKDLQHAKNPDEIESITMSYFSASRNDEKYIKEKRKIVWDFLPFYTKSKIVEKEFAQLSIYSKNQYYAQLDYMVHTYFFKKDAKSFDPKPYKKITEDIFKNFFNKIPCEVLIKLNKEGLKDKFKAIIENNSYEDYESYCSKTGKKISYYDYLSDVKKDKIFLELLKSANNYNKIVSTEKKGVGGSAVKLSDSTSITLDQTLASLSAPYIPPPGGGGEKEYITLRVNQLKQNSQSDLDNTKLQTDKSQEFIKKPGGVKFAKYIYNNDIKNVKSIKITNDNSGKISGISFVLNDSIGQAYSISHPLGEIDIPLFYDALQAAYNPLYAEKGKINEISFSLDWASQNAEVMDCHWYGVNKNTKLGWTMYEADRLLKCLHMGKDNLTGQVYSSATLPIKGFQNVVEQISKNPAIGKFNAFRGHRFWWVTDHMKLNLSKDKKSIVIQTVDHPRVRHELMNGLVDGESTGDYDEYDQVFVEWINNNYDSLAVHFPVLQDLKKAAYYYGIALLLKDLNVNADLSGYAPSVYTKISPLTSPIIKSDMFTQYQTLFGSEFYHDYFIRGGTVFSSLTVLNDTSQVREGKDYRFFNISMDMLQFEGKQTPYKNLSKIPVFHYGCDFTNQLNTSISVSIDSIVRLLSSSTGLSASSSYYNRELSNTLEGKQMQLKKSLYDDFIEPQRQQFIRQSLNTIINDTSISKSLKAEAWYQLSLLEKKVNNGLKADSCSKKALELEPLIGDYIFNRAYCLHLVKNYKEAIDFYEQYYKINHLSISSLVNEGMCYVNINKTSDGLGLLAKAIEKFSNQASPYYFSYLIYKSIGKKDEAINVLSSYIGKGSGQLQLSSGYENIYTIYGEELLKSTASKNQLEMALQCFETARMNTPKDYSYFDARNLLGAARVLKKLGKPRQEILNLLKIASTLVSSDRQLASEITEFANGLE